MSNPFVLTDLPNNDWVVSWPTFDDSFNDQMKINLLDLVFREIDCEEAGLGVSLDEKEESSIMWIKRNVWHQDLTEEYTRYLYKFYRIKGTVFHKHGEATKFKEILEKRYAWQLLKA